MFLLIHRSAGSSVWRHPQQVFALSSILAAGETAGLQNSKSLRGSGKVLDCDKRGPRSSTDEWGRNGPFVSHSNARYSASNNKAKKGQSETHYRLQKLIRFVGAIANLQLPRLEKERLKALMLLSFWGLFRGSELCTKAGEQVFLRHRDLKIKYTESGLAYLRITVRKSKTSQFKKTHAYVYSNQTEYCAVAAITKFVKLKEKSWSTCQDSHVFSWPGARMSVKYFNKLIKEVASSLGLKSKHYSSHCFRAGGATTATNRGVPPHVIKQMGRWTSNCFELYVKKPKEALIKAQSAILLGGR